MPGRVVEWLFALVILIVLLIVIFRLLDVTS
jgi:hypothetical protein